MNRKLSWQQEWIISFIFPLFLLIGWEILAQAEVLNSRYFPPPSAIFLQLMESITNGFLLKHLQITLKRLSYSFIIAAIPGVTLGLIMGMSSIAKAAIEPFINFIFPLPKIALLPLIMIIMGVNDKAFIVTAAITAFLQIVINTMVGVMSLEKVLLDAGRNYGAAGWRLFIKVILPGSLPYIFTGLRLGLGLAMILVIATEFVAAQEGLGKLVWLSWETLQVKNMYTSFIVVGILGFLITNGLEKLGERMMPWKKELQSQKIIQ